jgi:hypothetical protein
MKRGGLARRVFFVWAKKKRAVCPRHAREKAKGGICFNPRNAGSSAERNAVKLAMSEAAHPEASRSHEQSIILFKIKISQIWAKLSNGRSTGNGRLPPN